MKRDPERVQGPAADDPPSADFQLLADALSKLPAGLEPERDLWAGVASRLAPRSGRFGFAARPVAWWPQTLAALLGLAVGAAFTWLAVGGTADRLEDPDGPEGVRLASAGAGLAGVESQFLRAKEELWLIAFSRRDELSPEAWDVVQQNLQILDAAIANLRSALGENPGNAELQQRLLRNQRLSLDLLQDLARQGERPGSTV